ncbi:MAG TPA: TonB-dependent receptor, partial [Candidatus Solibacter sp.]|nr:TonB-dependent receptor [Candidatus Solibacter sp.]
NGNLVPIFDPTSTFVDANGNTMRNPIPGNMIPANKQNKIIQAFDKYFPAPNQPGNPFTRANNWFAQGATPSASNKADAKIDHNFSEKQRLTSRYGANWAWNGVANLTGNISHNGNPGINRFQNFILDYTRTHSPTTVFTARAGILRAKSIQDPLSSGFDAVKELGVSKLFQAAGVLAFPNYNTGSYRAMGAGGYAITHRFEDVYQFSGSMTKIQGGHTIKAGVEYRKYHENYFQPNTPNGSLTFSRNQTVQNPLVSSSSQGDGLASALLGFGSGGVMTIDYPTAQTAGYFGTYLNDDWRITRRLTLNLGVRYDFDIPRTDRYDRINWLDLSAPSPLADNATLKAIFPGRLNGLMRFADADNRSPYQGDYNNVQPRIGLAYALNNKTSIRAAWGLFYVVSRHTVKGEVGTAFGFTDTSIPWTLDSGRTQYATVDNPFPVGLTYPPGRNAFAFLGRSAGTPLPKDDNPQYQQWTFSIQREVPGHGVVEANYVGTKGTHLYFGQGDIVSELDPLASQYWGLGRNTLTSLVPNPFYGIITNPASTSYNQPTIQYNRLLRPYAAYTSVGGYRASRNIANSIYHAVTLKYEKRFSRGLSVIAHYTISKMISDSDVSGSDVDFIAGNSSIQDYFNLRNERSLSAFDVPQRLVVSFDYQLPLGRGRTFGKGMNRVLDAFVGGWEISSIISAQSRTPLGVTQSASTLWIGSQRPNLVGDPSMPGSVRDKLNNYFNVKAFSSVGPDLIGSAPRFLSSYRGPSQINENATLMKNFHFTERKYVQLRLEAYSVTNSPQWRNPDTGFGNTTFGQITAADGARSVQVAGKFYF